MEEPRRLTDGTGTELERALVQELRSYRGPRDMRAHTLAAIGATGATGLTAGGVLAWWSGKTWFYKLLLTVSATSLLGAVPAGYILLRQEATPPAPRVLPAVAPRQPQLPAPAITTAAPTAAASIDNPSPHPTLVRPPRNGVATGANLRAELATLDQVRSTLARGDFSEALALLEAYFGTFHHGRLRLEAQILRIDALAKAGQTDEARSYAKDFLRRHPNSVHAARLQSIVEP